MLYRLQFPESTPAISAAEGANVEQDAQNSFPSSFAPGKTNITTVTNGTGIAENAEKSE
jgi:hypothetical protein